MYRSGPRRTAVAADSGMPGATLSASPAMPIRNRQPSVIDSTSGADSTEPARSGSAAAGTAVDRGIDRGVDRGIDRAVDSERVSERGSATRSGSVPWMVALALVTALGTVAPAAAGGLASHLPATLWEFLADRGSPAEESVRRMRAVAAALAAAVRSLHSGVHVSPVGQHERGTPVATPTDCECPRSRRLGQTRDTVARLAALPERLLALPPPSA